MGLFSRNKKVADDSAVPEEIRDYYEAEKRDRMWVVWLLSGATFLVTVLVVLGLFWGGRWVYREITKDDQPATVTTEQNEQQEAQDANNTQEGQQADQPSGAQQTDQSSSASQSQSTTQSQTTTPSSTTTQSPANTPQTGPTTAEELPRTGPTSDD